MRLAAPSSSMEMQLSWWTRRRATEKVQVALKPVTRQTKSAAQGVTKETTATSTRATSSWLMDSRAASRKSALNLAQVSLVWSMARSCLTCQR